MGRKPKENLREAIRIGNVWLAKDLADHPEGRRWLERRSLIISIGDPHEPSPFDPSLKNVLRCEMLDLDREQLIQAKREQWPESTLGPSKEGVQTIIEHLQEKQPKRLFIHCHMGFSRSPAVGAIVLALRGMPAKKAVRTVRTLTMLGSAQPNTEILALADEILQLEKPNSLLHAELTLRTQNQGKNPSSSNTPTK
jgi:predicted protein tyrosine phosphatase